MLYIFVAFSDTFSIVKLVPWSAAKFSSGIYSPGLLRNVVPSYIAAIIATISLSIEVLFAGFTVTEIVPISAASAGLTETIKTPPTSASIPIQTPILFTKAMFVIDENNF